MNNKTILIVCISLLANMLNAQSIPNPGFENWHTVGGWYDNPDYWNSNNNSITAPGVVKDTNAYAGVLGMMVANVSGTQARAYTGFHVTAHPYSVSFYGKSTITAGDSVSVRILIYNGGVEVDSGRWFGSVSVPAWSPYVVSVSQNSTNADSMFIEVKTGSQFGTRLSIDEFTMDTVGLGLNEKKKLQSFNVFPNPTTDYFTLTSNKDLSGATIVLYNSFGQSINVKTVVGTNSVRIERGNLVPGFYVFTLSEKGQGMIFSSKLQVD
jgi:hypothetical protein